MSDKQFLLRNVSHAFGDVKVLDGVTLEIGRGEFIAIVGSFRLWQNHAAQPAFRPFFAPTSGKH